MADDKLLWLVIIHLTFVASALLMDFLDKIALPITAKAETSSAGPAKA